MAELVLNPVIQKALATAYSVTASQDGDHHTLTIYTTDDYNFKSELTIPGRVQGWQAYGEGRYTPGRSSCTLPETAKSVFKLLKAGDELSLEWWPDSYSSALDDKGMIGQQLRLIVRRKSGKDRIEHMALLLEKSVYEANNSWMMCRGFDVAEKQAERIAQREAYRLQQQAAE